MFSVTRIDRTNVYKRVRSTDKFLLGKILLFFSTYFGNVIAEIPEMIDIFLNERFERFQSNIVETAACDF